MITEYNVHPMERSGLVVGVKSDEQFNSELATKLVRQTNDSVARVETLVDRMKEAKAALSVGNETWKKEWVDWIGQSENCLKDLQAWRMAVCREQAQALRAMKDISELLGSPDHKANIDRLREIVELTERVQALKASGTLDSVVEILLK